MLEALRLMLSTAAKIRIAQGLYFVLKEVRRPFGGRDLVTVRRRGILWNLDLREAIDLTIYTLGAFEIETLRALQSLVRPSDTVLDVGANIGAHTLHLARLVGEAGRVFAFEPTDYAVAKLRANLRSNQALEPRVVVHQAFLVAEATDAVIPKIAASWPVDGTAPDDDVTVSRAMEAEGATAMTVDAVLEASGHPRIQLMKIDVDGHELEVLGGARSLLREQKPVIVMELAPYVFEPPEQFDAMVRLLGQAGYSFQPVGSSRTLPSDPGILRALIPLQGSVNVVARHKDANTR